MPTTPGCQPSPATTIAPWLACGSAGGLGGEQDAGLGLLAVAVEQVELARHLRGAVAVLGEQQLERGVGPAHAAGGVDARAEPEAERLLGELGRLDRGHRHQRPQAGLVVRASAVNPSRTMRRFSPRSGTRSQTVASAARSRCSSAAGGCRRLAQLQHDARGAQLRAWVVAQRRVHDDAVGQLLVRPVVIGDHDVEPGGLAAATCSTAVMPQSTVISSPTPRSASRSTAPVERP